MLLKATKSITFSVISYVTVIPYNVNSLYIKSVLDYDCFYALYSFILRNV